MKSVASLCIATLLIFCCPSTSLGMTTGSLGMTTGSLGLTAQRAIAATTAATNSAPAPKSAPHRLAATAVTRATLKNGLQVVVLRDPFAPVVSIMMNYETGADEEPITGLAHAQEHMMFRGSKAVSAAQFSEVTALLGGNFDADTQNEVTQYFFTVPEQGLDAALHLEASRAQGILDTQALWEEERGAIEQEVQRDNSSAGYRLYVKVLQNLMAGTPYADAGLGTMHSFSQQVNARQLQALYAKWYHPNNAILVIAGDVDPNATIAKVKSLFGSIPAKTLPARKPVHLAPLHPQTFTDISSDPETNVFVGFRFPGYDSSDYAAAQILLDVLNSQRGAMYQLVADGKAFDASAQGQTYPKAGMALVELDVSPETAPRIALGKLRGVIDGYRKNGFPADLVAAAKLREAAQAQFTADSISGLAQEWSQSLAVEHRSPDVDLAAIERVTPADVNR
ncbi:MAG: M16 family metallopeptidase, partial [Vulcanimicrobiaceae bacterium]